MSEGVKIHDAIRKWEGYAVFDKDNVLVEPILHHKLESAESVAFYDNHTVWSVTLTRKEKVYDNNAVKV